MCVCVWYERNGSPQRVSAFVAASLASHTVVYIHAHTTMALSILQNLHQSCLYANLPMPTKCVWGRTTGGSADQLKRVCARFNSQNTRSHARTKEKWIL